uniref:Ig-like domain-containing protein n=1 Tax=Poecilia formosa TaxID=48698 RepID=A0A087YIT8_POEFO
PDMPNLPSVSSSSGHIVKGDPINLTCSSDANPAATYTWYKKDTSGPLSKGSQLVFKSIQSSDSGEYYCKAQNVLRIKASKVVFIDVKYAPRLPSVALRPSGEVVRGTSVNLICSSDANPTAEYIWFKKNNPEPLSNDSQLVFESIQSSDSGEYYCTSENMLNQVTSEGMFIDVKYPPSFPIVSHSFSGEVVEGDSVTLACSADANPAATYTWYKEHEANPLSKGPKLVFRSVQSSDSGKYFCAAENVLKRMTSGSILINVEYAPKLPRISVSASEIMEGISLTLSCSSDSNPAANYTWFKENEKTPQSSGQNLTITNIGRQHSGLYFCEAHNSRGSHKSAIHLTVAANAPRTTVLSVTPSETVEGSSVTLTCSSDANPAAKYNIYRVNEGQHGQLLRTGLQSVFSSIQVSDTGRYYCTAGNDLGSQTSPSIDINVKYAPRSPSVSLSPSGDIMKGSSVTLTCSSDANPAANYSWRKNNNHSVVSKDQQFVLSSILSSDSGQYYCTELHIVTFIKSCIYINILVCSNILGQSMSSITSRLALLILISMLVLITTL